MRLEEDMKYDYKDVLIRPKRSTLGSRKEVDLNRGFTFRNYTPPMVAEPTAEPVAYLVPSGIIPFVKFVILVGPV